MFNHSGILLSVSIAIILWCDIVKNVAGSQGNSLIVISYDGFRNDYLKRNITPFLNAFREEGVSVPYMKNVFPTKTFPNHHTIATGVFPEVHGVMANEMFDRETGEKLGYGYPMFHHNKAIVPIWTLNEMQGQHSGCMMWPGSDFPYAGLNCTYRVSYNRSISWGERVDIAISWLKDKEKPANFVIMYFEDPDSHGHIYGPDSNVVRDLIIKLDNLTKSIQQKLKDNQLSDHVNVVHLSDHGMEGVPLSKSIDLRQFVANGSCNFYGSSPVMQVVPKPGKYDEVLGGLRKGAQTNGHFKVFSNEELLLRWHFNNTVRTGPITVLADPIYAFQDMFEAPEYYKNKYNITLRPDHAYGIHGYDNEALSSMYSMFMAKGPDFENRKVLLPFDTVDLYSLFAKILNISNPVPTNGTLSHLVDALKSSDSSGSSRKDPKVSAAIVALGSAMVSFSIVSFIATFVVLLVRKRSTSRESQEIDLTTSHEVTLLLKNTTHSLSSSSGSSTVTDTEAI